MAISRKLLNDDESVVVSTRTHAKALLGPALVLILVAAVAGFVTSFTPAAGRAAPPPSTPHSEANHPPAASPTCRDNTPTEVELVVS